MKSKTIFVIDDSADECAILEAAAELGGIDSRLRIVQDGATGLRYLEGRESYADRFEFPLPNLVLLDLNMPGLNGFEVLSSIRLRTELAWLPVIVFTSSEDPVEVRRAYDLGADGFLVKPMDFDDLVALMKFLDGSMADEAPDVAALQGLPAFRSYPHRLDMDTGNSLNGLKANAAYVQFTVPYSFTNSKAGFSIPRKQRACL